MKILDVQVDQIHSQAWSNNGQNNEFQAFPVPGPTWKYIIWNFTNTLIMAILQLKNDESLLKNIAGSSLDFFEFEFSCLFGVQVWVFRVSKF